QRHVAAFFQFKAQSGRWIHDLLVHVYTMAFDAVAVVDRNGIGLRWFRRIITIHHPHHPHHHCNGRYGSHGNGDAFVGTALNLHEWSLTRHGVASWWTRRSTLSPG